MSNGQIESSFKIMAQYAIAHEAVCHMVENVFEGNDIPMPGLPFADMVRVSMFEMQIDKGEVAVTGVDNKMFELSKTQEALVRKNLALPKVSGWIKQCIAESNFDSGAKAAYTKQLQEKGVSDAEWRATSVDFYYNEAVLIAQSKAVPTQGDMDRLKAIKDFLSCSDGE